MLGKLYMYILCPRHQIFIGPVDVLHVPWLKIVQHHLYIINQLLVSILNLFFLVGAYISFKPFSSIITCWSSRSLLCITTFLADVPRTMIEYSSTHLYIINHLPVPTPTTIFFFTQCIRKYGNIIGKFIHELLDKFF